MSQKYAKGTHAFGMCDRCGRKVRYRMMRFDGYKPQLRVCPECWDPPGDPRGVGRAAIIPSRVVIEDIPPLTCPPVGAPTGPFAENECIILTQADVVDGQLSRLYSAGSGKNLYISADADLVLTAPDTEFAFPPGGLSLDGGGGEHWIWFDTSRLTITGSSQGPAVWIGAFGVVDSFTLLVANERYGRTGTIAAGSDGFAIEVSGPIPTPVITIVSGITGITGEVGRRPI